MNYNITSYIRKFSQHWGQRLLPVSTLIEDTGWNKQCAIKLRLKPIAVKAPPSLISITTRIEGKFCSRPKIDKCTTSLEKRIRAFRQGVPSFTAGHELSWWRTNPNPNIQARQWPVKVKPNQQRMPKKPNVWLLVFRLDVSGHYNAA